MISDVVLEGYLNFNSLPVLFSMDSVPIQSEEDLQFYRVHRPYFWCGSFSICRATFGVLGTSPAKG
jgi:hypothetical protein